MGITNMNPRTETIPKSKNNSDAFQGNIDAIVDLVWLKLHENEKTMAKETNSQDSSFILEALELMWIGCCKGQTFDDGRNCGICHSKQHQAFDCPENPMVIWMHRSN